MAWRIIFVAAAAFAAGPLLLAQAPGANARDAVVDFLLFGADRPIELKAYSRDVRNELAVVLKRYRAYQSSRPLPENPASEQGMIYTARVAHERRLAAMSPDPKAKAIAREYVDRLRPCYEWEGGHDCPEREARFAGDYNTANPAGPFSDYLTLLAAHRWLCAAEGYENEKQPEGAAQSRKVYKERISAAARSRSRLIRFAAERLAERNACLPQPSSRVN